MRQQLLFRISNAAHGVSSARSRIQTGTRQIRCQVCGKTLPRRSICGRHTATRDDQFGAARGRVVDESDPSDEEGGAHFVRRSSRAAKPVARLSPDWKGDGEEDEEDETDDEGEYVDESETSEPDLSLIHI